MCDSRTSPLSSVSDLSAGVGILVSRTLRPRLIDRARKCGCAHLGRHTLVEGYITNVRPLSPVIVLPRPPRRISLHDAACDLDPFTVCELDYYGHSTPRISGGKIVGSDLYHLLSALLECRNRPAGSRIDDYVHLNNLSLGPSVAAAVGLIFFCSVLSAPRFIRGLVKMTALSRYL